jgi:hypothetical protein
MKWLLEVVYYTFMTGAYVGAWNQNLFLILGPLLIAAVAAGWMPTEWEFPWWFLALAVISLAATLALAWAHVWWAIIIIYVAVELLGRYVRWPAKRR